MTNNTAIEGTWEEQKAKLKLKFGVLSEEDLVFEPGKKEQMLENLQLKLGKTRSQLLALIETL